MQIIDIEASGLAPASYPIEIGVYDLDDPSKNLDFLIKPIDSWTYWDHNAESIHNIPRYAIEEKGIDIIEACHILNKTLDNIVYSDAPSFEQMWLSTLFEAANMEPEFDVQGIYNLIDVYKLGDYEAYRSKFNTPHRAFADAKIIGTCVKRFLRDNALIS